MKIMKEGNISKNNFGEDVENSYIQMLLVISMAAFFWLNLSSDRTGSLLGCIISIALVAVFMVRGNIFRDAASLPKPFYIVSGFLICNALSYNFYRAWLDSNKIKSIAAFIGCTNKQIVLPLSIICAVLAVPIVAVVLSHFVEIGLKDFLAADNQINYQVKILTAGRAFAILTGVYLVGISAILRANFNYIDDVGRVAEGYRDWGGFSRFLSDGLSVLIHTDSYITDISPLTQLIAVCLTALSGIMLIHIMYERKVYTVWEVLALAPLALNPYFLECISYKFDAPFMAVSIFAGIMPLLYKGREMWEYILAVSVGTVMVCTSYQAALGVFPMCVVLLALRMWMKRVPSRQICEFCLKSVLGFGIGMIFYKIVIMVPVNSYVSSSLPPLGEMLPAVITNYKCYCTMILSDFKAVWKLTLLLLCICFAVSGLILSRQKKILTILVVILSCAVMFLLCFGLYPALAKPIFEPRAMYGFGVFVTLLGISVAEYRQRAALRVPAIAISWMFFVFSLTYGNALYIQKTYTDFRIAQVITDLNDMEVFLGEKPVVVQIAGSIGQSPVVCSMSKSCNILNRLVPVQFRETWIWGQAQFYGYYGLKNIIRDTSQDLTTYGLPVIKDSMYHTIYGNDEYVLIELKQGSNIYLFENKR